MIRSLKRKFILLTMTSLFALLTVIVVGMNMINYRAVVAEADDILTLLTQNKGHFPEFVPDKAGRFPFGMSPETPYESRFFSVLMQPDGSIIQADTGRIASVNTKTAISYATHVMKTGNRCGFVGNYRYIRDNNGTSVRIIFLDCGRRLHAFRTFLSTSIIIALTGFMIVFLAVIILSGRIIRPIAESYEKQKRFITDAGHELKTPLTVINANIDLLEMEIAENECLSDIRLQTQRLHALTNDLVILAKMEESEAAFPMIDLPISEIVTEITHSYEKIAENQGKHFSFHIQPMLTLTGNIKSMERLITVLLDNAFKYSPIEGIIHMEMSKQNKYIILNVYNTSATFIEREQLAHIFDRFYRTDSSRNSETGGHGIGLSIAKAIVEMHKGKIQAWTQDGSSFGITASFPTE
ncbi:MAG: HAMP domain-containing histidine kinase [Clostridia bacterium]|nr:HAMP domain-containing histidine kinase [Clostridia bacterium]